MNEAHRGFIVGAFAMAVGIVIIATGVGAGIAIVRVFIG